MRVGAERGGSFPSVVICVGIEACIRHVMTTQLTSNRVNSEPDSFRPLGILVFKPQWLALILCGRKTLEVRGAAYKSGTCYFGTGGMIYAQAHLGRALRVENLRQFRRHQDMHRMIAARELPYKKTYLIPILSLRKIKRPYLHPRGAICVVRYVRPA